MWSTSSTRTWWWSPAAAGSGAGAGAISPLGQEPWREAWLLRGGAGAGLKRPQVGNIMEVGAVGEEAQPSQNLPLANPAAKGFYTLPGHPGKTRQGSFSFSFLYYYGFGFCCVSLILIRDGRWRRDGYPFPNVPWMGVGRGRTNRFSLQLGLVASSCVRKWGLWVFPAMS